MYSVNLDLFQGPLDLLLQLVDRKQLDITEISLASICGEYEEHIMRLREMNLEVESSFLTVFASLLEIKSRALLPAPPPGIEKEEEEDEHELVIQLREYRRFKEAALELDKLKEIQDASFPRPATEDEIFEEATLATQMSISDVFDAYVSVLRKWSARGEDHSIEIAREEISFPLILRFITKRIKERASTLLSELFDSPPDRLRFIVIFLVLLEMARRRRISLQQDEESRMITILNRKPAGSRAGKLAG